MVMGCLFSVVSFITPTSTFPRKAVFEDWPPTAAATTWLRRCDGTRKVLGIHARDHGGGEREGLSGRGNGYGGQAHPGVHSSASGRRPGGRRRAPTALRRHKPREHDFVHDVTLAFGSVG